MGRGKVALPLPIDPLIPAILAHLRGETTLVLEATAGAGKTTRVPPALLDLWDGEILVLEPRRMAARLAARYVAAARGEAVGETVGYQVRFEEAAGPRTRLRFLTEGVLTRRLLSDARLERVSPPWCWTNSTSATWKAISRWPCCGGCNRLRGRICAWS